ncbi:MAG: hypothetical protein E7559_04790 [Ruminococcaceae bacterium]|nr:hypothetical protein [Oscillospiraceae bacterium]
MKSIQEKLAYLKGLVEGLALDETKKDTKVINNMIGLFDDIVTAIDALQTGFTEMQHQVDNIDEDLGSIEEDLGTIERELCDDDDDTCTCGSKKDVADDIYYEVTCPTCGDTIHLDDDIISQCEIDCPNCGEKLEFDLEG